MIAALAAGLVAALYVGAAARVRWPAGRTACFVCGMAVLAATPSIGDEPLAAHMVEHAMLVAVAAPLLVLGAPVALALRSLHGAQRRKLADALRGAPLRWLTHPAVAWPLFVGVQWVTHLTPLIDVGDERPLLHAAEHAAIFWSAILFWAPVIGRNPVARSLRGWERSLYLFAAAPALDLVGVLLMARGESAAGVAMVAGMLPVTFAAVAVTWSVLVQESRRAAHLEGAHAPG